MSISSTLRKFAAGAAVAALSVTSTSATQPASATGNNVMTAVTSNLSNFNFIGDFNKGVYFSAQDSNQVYHIYYFNASKDPVIVSGSTDCNAQYLSNGLAGLVFNKNLYVTCSTTMVKIAAGKPTTATQVLSSIVMPRPAGVAGANMILSGDVSGVNTIYSWDGKAATATSLATAPGATTNVNVNSLKTVGKYITYMDQFDGAIISSDASLKTAPTFHRLTYSANGSDQYFNQIDGAQLVGTTIYFIGHDTNNADFDVVAVPTTGGSAFVPSLLTTADGTTFVNSQNGFLLKGKYYAVGNPAGASHKSLYVVNSADKLELAAGIDASKSWDYAVTATTVVALYDQDNYDMYIYDGTTLKHPQVSGGSVGDTYTIYETNGKLYFGGTAKGADPSGPEAHPAFTYTIKTGTLVASYPPTNVEQVFVADGHPYITGSADFNSSTALWTDRPVASAPADKTTKVWGFWGGDSTLNGTVTKQLKALTKDASGITAIECTGTTSGKVATAADKALAKARATKACAYLKGFAKTATTSIVTKTATGVGPQNRAVLVKVTR